MNGSAIWIDLTPPPMLIINRFFCLLQLRDAQSAPYAAVFRALAFHHARNRNPRPTRQHFSNFGVGRIYYGRRRIVLPSSCVAASSCFSSSGILPYWSSGILAMLPTRASLFNSDFRLFQFRFNGLRDQSDASLSSSFFSTRSTDVLCRSVLRLHIQTFYWLHQTLSLTPVVPV